MYQILEIILGNTDSTTTSDRMELIIPIHLVAEQIFEKLYLGEKLKQQTKWGCKFTYK